MLRAVPHQVIEGHTHLLLEEETMTIGKVGAGGHHHRRDQGQEVVNVAAAEEVGEITIVEVTEIATVAKEMSDQDLTLRRNQGVEAGRFI